MSENISRYYLSYLSYLNYLWLKVFRYPPLSSYTCPCSIIELPGEQRNLEQTLIQLEHTGLPTKDLRLKRRLEPHTRRKQVSVSGNREYKETDRIYSVQSSLKSQPLWVNLYNEKEDIWLILHFSCWRCKENHFNIFSKVIVNTMNTTFEFNFWFLPSI